MKIHISISRHIIAMTIIVVAMMMTSCRKDLCFDHYRAVSIQSDWEYAWERDYGAGWSNIWDAGSMGHQYEDFLPLKPEGITMLLYDYTENPSKSFLNPDGGDIVLNEGSHSILLYNNDTRYIILSDMATAPTARATSSSRTRASLAELHPGERSVAPPDVLFAAYSGDIPEVDLHNRKILPMTLKPLVYTYYIRFVITQGLSSVSLVRGALAGMAESVYLRTGATSNETATILFDCVITSFGAEADMRSFGVPAFPDKYYEDKGKSSKRYTLNLEIMLNNGRIVNFNYDVTSQMENQPRGGVITIDDIQIAEEDIGQGGSFDVNVSDWGEWTDIDIPIYPV